MQYGLTMTLYRITDWIMRVAYVNLLWISFTLVGFIIFGFFPATIAMFSICRKWVMGEEDIPVFKTFFKTYKTELIKGNVLGGIVTLIGYILWVDYQILQLSTNSQLQSLSYFFFIMLIFYGIFLLYLFPIYVHYELKAKQLVRNSLLLAVTNPLSTAIMIAGGLFLYSIYISISGIILFFSGSTISLLIMWATYRTFHKIERKK